MKIDWDSSTNFDEISFLLGILVSGIFIFCLELAWNAVTLVGVAFYYTARKLFLWIKEER